MPVQVLTPDLKLTGATELTGIVASTVLVNEDSAAVEKAARKRTNLKSRYHGFAVFVSCSTGISYCKPRTLQMRLRMVCANFAAGCSGV